MTLKMHTPSPLVVLEEKQPRKPRKLPPDATENEVGDQRRHRKALPKGFNSMRMPTNKQFIDITGQRFGRFTSVNYAGFRVQPSGQKKHLWQCRCECGNVKAVGRNELISGTTKSCGCLNRELIAAQTTHGACCNGRKTPEYTAWSGMIARCTKPSHPDFHNYGGRGVTACDRWRSFASFLKDMGPKPSPKYSIDRINNNGNYEPGNCRWATSAEQCRNRRNNRMLTHDGKTRCIAEWAEITGISLPNILNRINNLGWSVDRALVHHTRKHARQEHSRAVAELFHQ